MQNRPNDRCAEVRASATESRGDAFGVGADEPAHHWNLSQPKQRLDRPLKPFTGQAPDRSCLLVARVGNDAGAGIDVHRTNPGIAQSSVHQLA